MQPQFGQFYKKVVLRLSEQGDVIATQTIRFVRPKFFSKLDPCKRGFMEDASLLPANFSPTVEHGPPSLFLAPGAPSNVGTPL